MPHRNQRIHVLPRRAFLAGLSAGAAGLWTAGFAPAAEPRKNILPVAGVTTVYRPRSHADVILGKLLTGYEQDGGPGPSLALASLFVDQRPENDLSVPLSREHGFRLAASIDEALTNGTDELAVAGVLLVGEHGDYPNDPRTGQKMYPRRRLFDAITACFRRVGRTVPVFNDKHLAYRFEDARHMYDTARQMKFPLLAGSSLPVAWRVPPLVLPRGCRVEEAVAVGYGGLESYGFHTLEMLQCMVERRGEREVGVRRVEALRGEALQQAQRDGRWSRDLVVAACQTAKPVSPEEVDKLLSQAVVFLLEYADGLRATAVVGGRMVGEFCFAARLTGQPRPAATRFALQDGVPYGHFAYLVRAIEHLMHRRQAPYPVERTLLTTGVLDAALHSLVEQEARDTPQLRIAYEPTDWPHAPGQPPPVRAS